MINDIIELITEKQYTKLKAILSDMEPVDIAQLFEDLPERYMPLLYRLLPKESAAEVFVELDSDTQEMLIRGFSDTELKDVLDELYLDDAVDIIEEMPANVVKRIISHSAPEMRNSINEILKYPKDSAGSIMTIEFIELKEDMTVHDAFTKIRRTGVDKETIYTCYVTDRNRVLKGLVSAKDLLLSEEDCVIADIMEKNPICVNTMDDKEDVARALSKYDFLSLPVVDNENRLVGIVTVDDAIDVIEEEATEDIEKMAAITPSEKPYLKTGVWDTFLQRIPWLLLLMISATFTARIIAHFENALQSLVILSTFIPMLMDTGGNSGSQASVTIIRGISLDEIEFKDIFTPGYIRLDAERLRHVLSRAGRGRFAAVEASGPDRAARALDALLTNESLSSGTTTIRAILCGVLAGDDLRLTEISTLANGIRKAFGETAQFELATVNDEATFSGRISTVVMLFEFSKVDESATKARKIQSVLAPGAKSRGRFQNSESTLWHGENMDEPTYLRKSISLDL